MIQRNGSYIAGYMAGRNDRTENHPFDSSCNPTVEYQCGYAAGYEGRGQVVIEFPEPFKVGDRVRHKDSQGGLSDTAGTIEALETELGPKYASVKWDNCVSGFCVQMPKEYLVKVN